MRRKRAEADAIVEAFERSGQSRREFCAATGLSPHTLDYYRRRRAAAEPSCSDPTRQNQHYSGIFVNTSPSSFLSTLFFILETSGPLSGWQWQRRY